MRSDMKKAAPFGMPGCNNFTLRLTINSSSLYIILYKNPLPPTYNTIKDAHWYVV